MNVSISHYPLNTLLRHKNLIRHLLGKRDEWGYRGDFFSNAKSFQMLPGKIYTQLGRDLSTLPTVPLPSQDKDLWCRYFSLLDQILLLWFSGVVNSCVQHSAIHLVPIIPNGNRHDAEHLRWVMDSVPSQDEKCLCLNYSSRIDQDISRVCYHALYQGHFKRSLVRYLYSKSIAIKLTTISTLIRTIFSYRQFLNALRRVHY